MSGLGVQGLGPPPSSTPATMPSSELSSGYKLVPWSSWDQWNFVRESIFSSSPDSVAAAFRRISAWRSRGCLPVQIDVTAAIVETQQKDPFFRKEELEDALPSEETLKMLYCMATIRLVNGLVEPMHKKTGRSIAELADAVGIPRVLVDIRHESSHRDLPSLRLVRLASMKNAKHFYLQHRSSAQTCDFVLVESICMALDWLKSNYWEPQSNSIPDVRKEIRSRLREITYYLKTRNAQKLGNPQSKGSERQISRICKLVARLYFVYPAEVVSVLLEYFHLQISYFSDIVDTEHFDISDEGDPGNFGGQINDLKTIVTKISNKKPRLLLSLLDAVLEMIEVKKSEMSERSELHFPPSQHHDASWHMKYLCSLVPWLIMKLKALEDSGLIQLVDETQILYTHKSAMPKGSVTKILRRCLQLSVLGNKHLSDSVLLLAEMIGNSLLPEKLKKLPLPGWDELISTETPVNTGSILRKEEDVVKKAAEKLESIKLRLKTRKRKAPASTTSDMDETNSTWTVARNWIPCPIGMVPCSFSSTAVLPVLDKACDKVKTKKIDERHDNKEINENSNNASGTIEGAPEVESVENGTVAKRLKQTQEEQQSDSPETLFPMKGRLLIDGVYKRVTEEELLALESNIRLFV